MSIFTLERTVVRGMTTIKRDGVAIVHIVHALDRDDSCSDERATEADELALRIVSLLNRWSGDRKPN